MSTPTIITDTQSNRDTKFAIIGGGILGTLCALNISKLGYACEIIDQRPTLWNGATFAGEGKVHLGYVYGKATETTLEPLLRSAQSFADDLEFSVNRRLNWTELTSVPFEYGIPNTSLITAYEFEIHGEHLSRVASHVSGGDYFKYLGQRLNVEDFRTQKNQTLNTFFTPERSVDVPKIRAIVMSAIEKVSLVQCMMDSTVTDVRQDNNKVILSVEQHESRALRTLSYDYVVNCAWENGAYLDSLACASPQTPRNLRSRMFLHGRTLQAPRALTLTLGPFGDFVAFADGRMYASWYPTGLNGFVESTRPPGHWSQFECPSNSGQFIKDVKHELSSWIPQISDCADISVHSRTVVAEGNTDIDDPESSLHQRAGSSISRNGRWISVKSFKLTSGPSAARQLHDFVEQLRDG